MDGLRGVVVSRGARLWQGAGLACCLGAIVAAGLPRAAMAQRTEDPLASTPNADPLELGRRAAALGDDAVLARLADGTPRTVRLAAVRAARFLRQPERALAPLGHVARGRDPDLAPAAALAILRIVGELDLPTLERRELRAEDFAAARRELAALADDGRSRADVRAAARRAASRLAALLGPAAS